MTMFEAILLTIVTASTPLLIAAIGELVTERSGVLNLGVEGMLAMGAACSFAAAVTFDSTFLGVAAGMLAGVAMAAVFALAVLGFAANQVGSGLALTILGLGLSGLIGAPFVGARRNPVEPISIPGLSDIPLIGRLFFEQDLFVYASMLLTVAVALYLSKTRSGLTLRSIGENHTSAHGLGLPVLRMRLLAILFGGACSGLAGAYLSLVYTRFWSSGMTAGRGWIALALVVFAAWRPGWVLVGAYIFGAATVLQLHAQAAQFGVPSQLLSAVPYLATILALLLLSIRHGRAIGAPGSLGSPFVPDR
ncbi:ABC transporter permease [Microvirga puerhi]|uniref:ABC transporter permease n=1 Tax=Microvirga puerhi TaxID=2876078 RepID=A0ABS7VIU3_9HYPH|nr:ABC transporter permease [Microvirga puerhi]MBZ6075100.1 ABC transporter permease [Microvirga puerhi]